MKIIAGLVTIIDCGSVSKGTRGSNVGFVREGSNPPFNWFTV
jgi:hypothetical protein